MRKTTKAWSQAVEDAMKKTATTKPLYLEADICLYGTSNTGAGFIVARTGANHDGAILKSEEVRPGRTLTEALWLAVDALRAADPTITIANVYEPAGHFTTRIEVQKVVPSFGMLTWSPVRIAYVLSDFSR